MSQTKTKVDMFTWRQIVEVETGPKRDGNVPLMRKIDSR